MSVPPPSRTPCPVKVAHVITRMIIGGAQENTLLTVLGLQQDPRFVTDLITGCETGPEGRLDLSGIRSVLFIPQLVRNISLLKDIYCIIRLASLFRKKHYDIVHTHSSKAGIIGRIAAKISGVPVIIHTIHGLPFHPYEKKWINFIFIMLERLCSGFTSRIIVVADQMKKKALAAKIGHKNLYTTVFSGMVMDNFINSTLLRKQRRAEMNIPEHSFVIGKIARFFPLKGHDYILKIAPPLVKKHPEIIFLCVGNGILLDQFRSKISELGLRQNFIFTGLVTPEEIPGCLSVMDLLVHTSLREGLARVIPQAFSAGVPVVSFDIDGASDIISDGENGFLVPAENTGILLDKILRLLENTELRKKFSENGKKAADPFFRHEYMTEKIKKIYMELT